VGSGKAVAEKSTPVARPVALLMVATLGLLEANVAATTPVVPKSGELGPSDGTEKADLMRVFRGFDTLSLTYHLVR